MLRFFLFIVLVAFGLCYFPQVAFGQKEGPFKLRLCDKTIKDAAIEGILIIDTGKRDTINANVLLQGGILDLNHSVNYSVLFIGKKKWNYYSDIGYYRGYPGSSSIDICFDYNAKHTKKGRVTDFKVSNSDRYRISWTKMILKKKKRCVVWW